MTSSNNYAVSEIEQRRNEEHRIILVRSKGLKVNQDCELADLIDSRKSGTNVGIVRNVYSWVQELITRIFTKTATNNASITIYQIGDQSVDPLRWNGTMEWRWFTGIGIYAIFFLSPLIIGFTITYLLQIRDTNEDPSSW